MNSESPLPTEAEAQTMLVSAIGQIQFARRYTLEMLGETPQDLWFEIPDGYQTCIAWQVGHLAVSQYGLLMFRIRGRNTDDLELIPGRFRKAYGRGSTPNADATGQPTAEELVERLQRVHDGAMQELAALQTNSAAGQILLEPVEMPYAAYPVKLGAILFCPLHENIHAGQIGLMRRHFGLPSIR